MALFGLFGKKDEDPQPKDAFFLEDEVAKSMGDTSYMKQAKSIRRTYPKVAGGEYFEVVKTVSSMKSVVNDSRQGGTPKRVESTSSYSAPTSFNSASSFGSSYSAPAPTPAPEFSAPEPTTPSVSPSVSNEASQARRRSDSGMDMFRNMAKDIRK